MKKKDSGIGKLYGRFTSEERFRLVIEALSRGDEQEAERLAETCPRATYTMSDLTYGDRLRASSKITMIVCLDLAPRLAKLRMLRAFRELLTYISNRHEDEATLAYLDGYEVGFRQAWETAGSVGDPPGWEDGDDEDEDSVVAEELRRVTGRLAQATGDTGDHLRGLERSVSGGALTVWEAFANFCNRELLVQPEKLVKVGFEPILPEIERLKNIPEPPEVDQEVLEEYEAALKEAWSRLVRLV